MTQTQQQYLKAAKAELISLSGEKVTWDNFAGMCDIEPRAFKTYRMPPESSDYRAMPKLAYQAIERVLEGQRKKVARRAKK